jgi:hypothetical protein
VPSDGASPTFKDPSRRHLDKAPRKSPSKRALARSLARRRCLSTDPATVPWTATLVRSRRRDPSHGPRRSLSTLGSLKSPPDKPLLRPLCCPASAMSLARPLSRALEKLSSAEASFAAIYRPLDARLQRPRPRNRPSGQPRRRQGCVGLLSDPGGRRASVEGPARGRRRAAVGP